MTQVTNPTPSDASGEPMRSVVTHYGHATYKNDPITPDLLPYAEKVLAIDPITGVPGNVSTGQVERPAMTIKLEALSPDDQAEVRRQIELRPNMPPAERAQLESRLVAELVRGKLGAVRAQTGLGPDALPYHREAAEIAGQVAQLQRQRNQLQEAMDDIADVKPATDPATGEMVAEPVYRFSEERREAYAKQITDIDRNIRLLMNEKGEYGVEAKRRMREALAASAKQLKRAEELRTIEVEARKLVASQDLEAQIAKRAAQLSSMKPSRE